MTFRYRGLPDVVDNYIATATKQLAPALTKTLGERNSTLLRSYRTLLSRNRWLPFSGATGRTIVAERITKLKRSITKSIDVQWKCT